jgi:hypothetical protein
MTTPAPLTLDSLIGILAAWRAVLPGDTPIVHAIDDEGDNAEPLAEAQTGYYLPPSGHLADIRLGQIISDDDALDHMHAQRALVLWPWQPARTAGGAQ